MASVPPPTGWDIEVIADSDTRWKWGATLVEQLAPADSRVHASLLTGRSTPSTRQLDDVGIAAASWRRGNVAETLAEIADSRAELVVLACGGGTVQALLHGLAHAWQGRIARPVVVTGYVGLVYEQVTDGLLLRAGADIVFANSSADAETFRAIYAGAGADPDSVVRTALPFLGDMQYDPEQAGHHRPYTVTFVTQPGVPESKAERSYALREAARHAQTHPDREVLVKLRGRPGERSTHVEPYHYANLLPATALPTNLHFAYGAMGAVLDRTDLCVTVSSTAALEAMHRGIPTAVLVDFGVREALGNQVFLGSGALTSWADLHTGAAPKLEPDWAARHGVIDPDPYRDAVDRVRDLVGRRTGLEPLRPVLTARDQGGYLPQLLAMYGLDVSGAPIPGATLPPDPSRRARAARAAARHAYALAVRVAEPRLKRLAKL